MSATPVSMNPPPQPPTAKPQMPELPAAAAARLAQLEASVAHWSTRFVGYPCSQDYHYPEIMPFLRFAMNNLGDPFTESNIRENTFEFEREVIQFFQKHLHADPEQTWGYMTGGGTEGNLYGLFLARERFPDGMIYFSEHTHYSAAKIVRVLGARSIMIRGQDDGQIDYEDLRETLKLHRDVPPILFLNVGTTMHGAIDQLSRIKQMLRELAITRYYLHVDAALSGMILPFVENAPLFDFMGGIDSIAVSGHKMIGSPIPCGVVLAKRRHVDFVARGVEYVGCLDTTIAGSRSAIAPLIIWCALQRWGEDGLRQRVQRCLEMAEYAVQKFREAGIQAWRHEHSITVVFPNPGPEVVRHWQIAPSGNIAHIITMPHITVAMIDEVVQDIANALTTAS